MVCVVWVIVLKADGEFSEADGEADGKFSELVPIAPSDSQLDCYDLPSHAL